MPLILNNDEWKRINKHLEKKDPSSRNRAYITSVTKASAEMTKNWPNSLENVNKRSEELRKQRAKKAEMSNAAFYKKYVAKKVTQRERMLVGAHKQIFKDKDAPKALLGGFIAADVHREWKRQTKFNKELAEEAKQKKDAYDAEQKVKYKEWKEQQQKKALKKQQEDMEVGNFVKEQARERKEKLEKEQLDEVALERQDNITANQELAMLQNFERQLNKKHQQSFHNAINSTMDSKNRHDEEIKIRDQLDDNLQDIYLNSKHRIDCIRKKKELEMRNEKLRIVEQIGNSLRDGNAARDKKEKQTSMDVEEALPMFSKERREADTAHKIRLAQELKDMHEQCLQKEKELKHHNATLASWEMLNRLKNEENTKEFYRLEKEEKKRKILKYREELIVQQNEKKQREVKERGDLRYFYGEKAIGMLEKADNEFFAHADDVVKECLNTDRPPFAVKKVVDNFKKLHRLYPMPDMSKITKDNLEWSKKAPAKIDEDKTKLNKEDFEFVPGSKDDIRDVPYVFIKRTLKFLPCSIYQPTKCTSGSGPRLRNCHMQ